jgi:hypothetical protein
MFSEFQTWGIISVVGVIWLALILVGAVSGKIEQFSTIADIVPILLVIAAVFERWGWKLRFLHPHLISVPIIHGTWKGELQSLWVDPSTGKSQPKKTVYLTIEQTLTTISLRLMSDESSSEQIAGTLTRSPSSGRRSLAAIYVNTPSIDRRDKSAMHRGSLSLDIHGNASTSLEGEYWTDRASKGKLLFDQVNPTIAESFRDAESLSYQRRVRT